MPTPPNMLLARTRGTTRPSCSSTKVLKLGVTVLELALLHLREEVAQLDIFFPLRRKGVVVLPALVRFRLRGLGRVLLGQRGQLALLAFGHGSNSWQKGRTLKLRGRGRRPQWASVRPSTDTAAPRRGSGSPAQPRPPAPRSTTATPGPRATRRRRRPSSVGAESPPFAYDPRGPDLVEVRVRAREVRDRKSTRLNSSHSQISYAVFCLKKKKKCIAG